MTDQRAEKTDELPTPVNEPIQAGFDPAAWRRSGELTEADHRAINESAVADLVDEWYALGIDTWRSREEMVRDARIALGLAAGTPAPPPQRTDPDSRRGAPASLRSRWREELDKGRPGR